MTYTGPAHLSNLTPFSPTMCDLEVLCLMLRDEYYEGFLDGWKRDGGAATPPPDAWYVFLMLRL